MFYNHAAAPVAVPGDAGWKFCNQYLPRFLPFAWHGCLPVRRVEKLFHSLLKSAKWSIHLHRVCQLNLHYRNQAPSPPSVFPTSISIVLFKLADQYHEHFSFTVSISIWATFAEENVPAIVFNFFLYQSFLWTNLSLPHAAQLCTYGICVAQ